MVVAPGDEWIDDVLPLIKKLCNLQATWEEATAGLEKQAAASD